MNVQNKKIAMILGGIFILGAGIGAYIFSKKEMTQNVIIPKNTSSNELPPETIAFMESRRGIIASSTTKGYKTYTSKKYGIQFSFPEKWRAVDNYLGYSAFQLYNYPETNEPPFAYPEISGKNDIHATIFANNSYKELEQDYIDSGVARLKGYTKKQLMIAGQPATRIHFKKEPQETIARYGGPVYLISIPDSYDHLIFSMYGDPANFHQLDELVKTIKWLPVK